MSVEFAIQELFTVLQLAEFLKKKPATIYSDLIRRPESLPPTLKIPRSSRVLFVNPRQWAAGFVNSPKSMEKILVPLDEKPVKRSRGRPTNSEKIEAEKMTLRGKK